MSEDTFTGDCRPTPAEPTTKQPQRSKQAAATVVLPTNDPGSITERDKPLTENRGGQMITIGAGDYRFCCSSMVSPGNPEVKTP